MSDTTTPVADPAAPLPADLADERLVKEKGLVQKVPAGPSEEALRKMSR